MTSHPLLGVIADDLTGGAAIAGEIARDGGQTVDLVRLDQRDPPPCGSVIVETGSRYIDPAEAADAVTRARAIVRQLGVANTMKKIDSTLKGNVGNELSAFVADSVGPVVIVPACPAVSVGVRGGRQYRGGEAGRDIAAMLAEVLDDRPALLPLETVRDGAEAVAGWLDGSAAPTILVDAFTQADLDAVVHGSRAAGISDFAGTYGLGAALRDADRGPRAALPTAERMVVLAGSANPTTVAQLRRLVAEGADEIVVNVDRLITNEPMERRRVRTLAAASSSRVVVVHTDPRVTEQHVTAHRFRAGWSERDLAQCFAGPFVDTLGAIADAAVYLIGGETTGAICDQVGWHKFTVTHEVTTGVPVLREETGQRPFILTKPGAFGAQDDVLEATRFLLSTTISRS